MARKRARRRGEAAASAIFILIFAAAAQAVTNRVGVTTAVNPAATGQPPAGETRALFVGANVLHDERIVTTDSGQAQIMFLDQSALTIAPRSDITIDRFVYDPSKSVGKLAATVTEGALRFVGGRISKQEDVVFTTPTSTIGVRGGVVMIEVGPNGVTRATFLFGEHMNVTAGGVTRVVTRPNFTVTVDLRNKPPSPPTPTPQHLIRETLHALEGTRGASRAPAGRRVEVVTLARRLLNGNPVTFVVTGTGKGSAAQSPDDAAILAQAAQNGATQSLNRRPAIPTTVNLPGSFSGGLKVAPESGNALGTTDFSDGSNQAFANGTVRSSLFATTIDNTRVTLPATQIGSPFQFTASEPAIFAGSGGSNQPFSGTGFIVPSGDFLYYQLTQAGTGREAFLFAGVPTPAPALQSSGFGVDAFSVNPDFMTGSSIPFITQSGGGNIPNAQVSPLFIARQSSGSLGQYPIGDPERSTALQVSIAIDGQGTGQSSAFSVMTGAMETDPSTGKPLLEGGVVATTRQSATDQSGDLAGTVPGIVTRSSSSVTGVPDPSGNTLFGQGGDNFMVLDSAQTTASLDPSANAQRLNQTDSYLGAQDLPSGSTGTQYGFNQIAQRTAAPAPPGLNSNRTLQTLNGYVGGLIQAFDFNRSSPLDNPPFILQTQDSAGKLSTPDPTRVAIRTFPSFNRLSAQFNLGNTEEGDLATLNFGGVGNAADIMQPPDGSAFSDTTSAFVSDSTFAARQTIVINGNGISSASPSTFNGSPVIGSGPDGIQIAMATSSIANVSTAFPGVQFCQCQYAQWGFWTGAFSSGSERDAVNLGLWVAGPLASVTDFNNRQPQGQATYNGHIIGDVYNNGAMYVAAGNFTNVWTFAGNGGAGKGSVTISNFDKMTFPNVAVTSSVVNGNVVYSGTFGSAATVHGQIPPVHGPVQGSLNGAFFKSPTDITAETGGQFNIKSSGGPITYKAGGIFAATKAR